MLSRQIPSNRDNDSCSPRPPSMVERCYTTQTATRDCNPSIQSMCHDMDGFRFTIRRHS
ncbi:hypothetical protein EI94DRAFT_1735217 [Lactarius quietus]|nr:hypothetical protein EI94DRAFT_1735217 [Lactarius quietus]